ncbi:HD-GYP domain-containing protein [Ammoniphilus resinae]|uniref:Nucleotidyltransferase with HDIG domain n=1 Tax=Ammoniphilus resinae TaxID=861532 RepID=A0ABS4GU00_9BACL|nr:putative nucleotidyltransferase with HDIG domain [Ammoniphilus resinae]
MKSALEYLEQLKNHHYETFLHSHRVAGLSLAISKQLGCTKAEQEEIYYGGILHDIGKLKIHTEILNKPGKLTLDEWKIIQQHPLLGYQMLEGLSLSLNIREIILIHHERVNGRGYPFGLKKEQISLGALIVAVSDSFDAMTNNRPYHSLKTVSQAIEELKREKETLYSPQVVDALVETRLVRGGRG